MHDTGVADAEARIETRLQVHTPCFLKNGFLLFQAVRSAGAVRAAISTKRRRVMNDCSGTAISLPMTLSRIVYLMHIFTFPQHRFLLFVCLGWPRARWKEDHHAILGIPKIGDVI